MSTIPFNPYIVGNPIKSRQMFFGREDDFAFVQRKIGEDRANQIVVLCGERRSGKTSVLFQILGGRLGDAFLPVLIDMQMLAGVQGDRDFFAAILRAGSASPALADIRSSAREAREDGAPAEQIDAFLSEVERRLPGRIVLFLFDEYELIESKIRDGTLGESAIHAFCGILESPRRVSFIFTGSTNLEDRQGEVWKSLLGKSIYRKISYLSRRDTMRLITEPLGEAIRWPAEVTEDICRLTGGQPFYTQVICQNMVDLLIEEDRGNPSAEDLERIVREIVDNPLPQMIYSWNAIAVEEQVVLSALAGGLDASARLAGAPEVQGFLSANRILLPFPRERVNVLLEAAFHGDFLEKGGDSEFRFKMDIFRRWIRREHSIWKVAREAGLAFRRRRRPLAVAAIAAAGVLVLLLFAWLLPGPRFLVEARGRIGALLAPAREDGPGTRQAAAPGTLAAVQRIAFRANRGPFRLSIDGQQTYTSEGQIDGTIIVVQSLSPGRHRIIATPLPGPPVNTDVDVIADGQVIDLAFARPAAAQPAAAAVADTAPPIPPAAAEQRPAPAPTQEVKPGLLVISSRPPDAHVFIDGLDTGRRTPFTESMKPGTYDMVIELPGYRRFSISVTVQADSPLQRDITLEEAWGQLTLDVRPTAKIYLDGTFLVETPYAKPVRVRAGAHTLRVENEELGVNRELAIVVGEGETRAVQELLKETRQ